MKERSDVGQIMANYGVPYGGVLDVGRYHAKPGNRVMITENIIAGVTHALKGVDPKQGTYILQAVKKKKEVRPPDIQAKTLDAPAAPAKETDDQKAKREGFNLQQLLRVMEKNEARHEEYNAACLQVIQGLENQTTPGTQTEMGEDEDFEDMDDEADNYLKKLLAYLAIYERTCRGGANKPPALKGIQAMTQALTVQQEEGESPVRVIKRVKELLKVANDQGVTLVVDTVDDELLEEEKLRRKDTLHQVDDRGFTTMTWDQEKTIREKANKKVEMFVGLHSMNKKKSKEASYIDWLLNLAGTTGSTDVYPSNIGAIPGEIARFQWTGDEGGKKPPSPTDEKQGKNEESKAETGRKEGDDDAVKLVCATAGAWKLDKSDPIGSYFNPRGGRKDGTIYKNRETGRPLKCFRDGCGEYGHLSSDCSNPNLPPLEDKKTKEEEDSSKSTDNAVAEVLYGGGAFVAATCAAGQGGLPQPSAEMRALYGGAELDAPGEESGGGETTLPHDEESGGAPGEECPGVALLNMASQRGCVDWAGFASE